MTPAERHRRNTERLDSLNLFGIKLGLEQTEELFRRSGAPLSQRYLHIAGTNGKGSCGAMLEAALRGAGYRTGFYSSPHLVEVCERFRIDGVPVSAAVFDDAFEVVEKAARAMHEAGRPVTYFEFTTALAALIFARAGVDFAVWETGMGGRCDATSVVVPEAAIITNIALDHQKYLGGTIAAIAGEKAGIIRAGAPLFTGFLVPEAEKVIAAKAAELGVTLRGPDPEAPEDVAYGRDEAGLFQTFRHRGRHLKLRLAGPMQRENFRTVYPVLAWLSKKDKFPLEHALAGLERAVWPARCQEVTPRLIVDGGHNPHGIAALAATLAEAYPGEKFTIVFGGFRDKDAAPGLRLLAPLATSFVFTDVACERPAWSGAELAAMLAEAAPEMPMTAIPDPAAALAAALARPGRTLVAGSLYLAGEILKQTGAPV